MRFQTVTNIVVVFVLLVNTYVLFRLGDELRVANEKLARADEVVAHALEVVRVAEAVVDGVTDIDFGIDDATKQELRSKATEKLGELLDDLIEKAE